LQDPNEKHFGDVGILDKYEDNNNNNNNNILPQRRKLTGKYFMIAGFLVSKILRIKGL
jgi:hypothetical protein